MKTSHVFQSEKGKNAVLSKYNEILNAFPVEKRYIKTSFGKTFFIETGESVNPAVVLLHGSCSNSAFWIGDMLALSERFHVFTVDIIGEAGNSEENRQDPASDAYALWMKEVMDRLGLTQAILMGNSMGGWMALKFAVTFPQHVSKLVLIASSGIIPANPSFLSLSSDALQKGQDGVKSLNETVLGNDPVPKEVRDFIDLIMKNFIPMTDELPVYSKEQLKNLTMPVLFIAGGQDPTMNAQNAAKRLSESVPHANIHLLKDSGHIIVGAMDFVLPFLSKERDTL